jgi:hypothetical protein
MKEVTVQAVPLDGEHLPRWYACECSACGPFSVCVKARVNRTCQEHLIEHGAVGITKT